jgi:Tetratricopeptide repeat
MKTPIENHNTMTWVVVWCRLDIFKTIPIPVYTIMWLLLVSPYPWYTLVLGAEHPSMLVSMVNLALTYSNKGWFKEAEGLEVQVIETRKRVLGVEHPDTLTSIMNLASTFWNQGQLKEAEGLDVQAMEMSLRVLRAEHPDTLTYMSHLALTYGDQGQWKEAEELQVGVCTIP